jgi:hypothetical protein
MIAKSLIEEWPVPASRHVERLPGGPCPAFGTWEITFSLPLAQNYAPPSHNGDRETHDRNRRRVGQLRPRSPDQSLRNLPDPHLLTRKLIPPPPFYIFKTLQIISEPPSKPGISVAQVSILSNKPASAGEDSK